MKEEYTREELTVIVNAKPLLEEISHYLRVMVGHNPLADKLDEFLSYTEEALQRGPSANPDDFIDFAREIPEADPLRPNINDINFALGTVGTKFVLGEVADILVGYKRGKEFRKSLENLTERLNSLRWNRDNRVMWEDQRSKHKPDPPLTKKRKRSKMERLNENSGLVPH